MYVEGIALTVKKCAKNDKVRTVTLEENTIEGWFSNLFKTLVSINYIPNMNEIC